MQIEYEAKFIPVDKDEVRVRLRRAGAVLARPEFLQKRVSLHLPAGCGLKGGWARVRDEGGRITMSVKAVDGERIDNQKEAGVKVDDFDRARTLLAALGCREKSYQETKREIWQMGAAEIVIDEWPFLEPLVEIESNTEAAVREAAERLGFDYACARFGAVGTLYAEKYGLNEVLINNHTPLIVFEMDNPFVSR